MQNLAVSRPTTSDPEVVLFDGKVALATLRAEKLLMDAGGGSGDAGILLESSEGGFRYVDDGQGR